MDHLDPAEHPLLEHSEIVQPRGKTGRSKLYVPQRYQHMVTAERAHTPIADAMEQKLAPLVAKLEQAGQLAPCKALARAIVVIRWAEVTVDQGRDGESDPRLFRAQEIKRIAQRLLENSTIQETANRLVSQYHDYTQARS